MFEYLIAIAQSGWQQGDYSSLSYGRFGDNTVPVVRSYGQHRFVYWSETGQVW